MVNDSSVNEGFTLRYGRSHSQLDITNRLYCIEIFNINIINILTFILTMSPSLLDKNK